MSVTRVLIANRGEIAVRIIKACKALGIETVAIYSDADAEALHTRVADQAVRVGAEAAADSYLNIDHVLAAAQESGADAIHPGYGFLSENPNFVERVKAAGLTFVGPTAEAMRALGDKARAKEVAKKADVPTVPEWSPEAVPADAYPVLVKAAAGGGGRGMRRVDQAADLPDAIVSAKREALAGFGDDTLIVEQLITDARHVEVQLLADEHGNIIYAGDRDCSLQRRHQKVVEEAPAPGLSHPLRAAMGEAAVRLAEAAGYTNAGTAEFLVDQEGRYYFLELNARLQVEHPVTEEAFGLDLAQWQLRIARGEKLTVRQEEIIPIGHSIEVRLYAEDPVTFLPTGGEIAQLSFPTDDGVRIEHGLTLGDQVSLAYDPLLAKVIVTATTRESARRKMLKALRQLSVLGAFTNSALLIHALELEAFVSATHHVKTLEENLLTSEAVEPSPALIKAARRHLQKSKNTDHSDPFTRLKAWRHPGLAPTKAPSSMRDEVQINTVMERGDSLWFSAHGVTYEVPRSPITQHAAGAETGVEADHAALTAPMPGTVIAALATGSEVNAGEAVVVLEAMKMETTISAPFTGKVREVRCVVGDLVSKGSVLAELDREEV